MPNDKNYFYFKRDCWQDHQNQYLGKMICGLCTIKFWKEGKKNSYEFFLNKGKLNLFVKK